MPRKRLKPVVTAVAKRYLKNGLNMTEALSPLNEHLSYKGLTVKASRWKKGRDVEKAIQKELESFQLKELTPEKVLGKLYSIVFDNDNQYKSSDKVRCLELIGKYLSLFKDTLNVKTEDINLNMSQDELKRELESTLLTLNHTRGIE